MYEDDSVFGNAADLKAKDLGKETKYEKVMRVMREERDRLDEMMMKKYREEKAQK